MAGKTTSKKTKPKYKNGEIKQPSKSENIKKAGIAEEEETASRKELILAKLNETPTERKLQVAQIILFSIAIFFAILVLFEGSSGWAVMHKFFRGVFGIPVFLVPAGLGWIVYKIGRYLKSYDPEYADKMKKTYKPVDIRVELTKLLLLVIAVCGFVQIMYGKDINTKSFFKTLGLLYSHGAGLKGAGALSIILAYPLVKFMGAIGARIVSVFILFISVMIASGSSIGQLINLLFHPGKTFDKFVDEHTFEPDPDTDEYYDFAATGKIPVVRQEENRGSFIDIALPDEPTGNIYVDPKPEIEEMPKRNIPKPDKAKTEKRAKTDSAADSLEEMIKRATSQPETKKSKQEEKANMMLSVNQEFREREKADPDGYQKPPIGFLQLAKNGEHDREELLEKGKILQETFQSFGVNADIADITMGPTVIRYEVKPAPGVKVAKITNLADDIALNLAASGVRIEAPIPGKSVVGIEVPNNKRDVVCLREILESKEFLSAKSKLSFAVGKDISGKAIVGDIAKMPHVIIAGSTGSGKSVCTNSIIMSILYNASPSEVKLILIDPKIVEFRVYDGIPHLLIPVVTDPKKAAGALNWAVQEMLRRYQVFADTGARDLHDYNNWCREEENNGEPMPQIVICIDELADLMMAASKEVEDAICRLAQMARAAGMHIIIATQRPTTDIITGLIKANIPSRIALSVMSGIDSRTILDMTGAEKLVGHGDMLYLPQGMSKPVRIQGCFVSTKEVEKVVDFIKAQVPTEYNNEVIQAVEENEISLKSERGRGSSVDTEDYSNDDKELINKAIDIIVSSGQASISMLQRRLKLGYARAARIMDELEEMDIIGPSEGAKPRRVKINSENAEEYKL